MHESVFTHHGIPSAVMPLRLISDVMAWRRRFPGQNAQAAEARRLVKLLLQDTPRAEDAEWIVAELASNAIIHTRSGRDSGFFVVEVIRQQQLATVVVYDQGGTRSPRLAFRSAEDAPDEHGHGLRGVAVLASRVGMRGSPDTGHAVWASLRLTATAQRVAP